MTGVVDAPDASQKLRLVLDYLPCEACLAQPVKEQDLLCSICRRLHRQVAVRVTTRTAVILERPTIPVAPVVIPPAAPEPAPLEATPEPEPVVEPGPPMEPVVEAPPPAPLPPPVPELEVVTEPYEEPPPVPLAVDMQDEPPEAPLAPVAAEEPEEPTFDDDVASVSAFDESFEVARGDAEVADETYEVAREEPVYAPPPQEPEPVVLSESMPEDDYVFRPPPDAEPVPEPVPIEEPLDEIPVEEIPLEPETPAEEPSPWAPPVEEEILPEESPAPEEPSPWQAPPAEPEPEDEVVEMEVVEDEPSPPSSEPLDDDVVEMQVVEDDAPEGPPPAVSTDLHRLRGFASPHETALRAVGVDSIASLAGHDPNELASRTGLPADLLTAWVHVADLVHEVGVPIDNAIALVAAGIPGPRGLRDMGEDDILDRVEAFGGVRLSGRDLKRWKRRV